MSAESLALGLDLGSSSIGWALIRLDSKGDPAGLVDCGVRVFPEVVDKKTQTPLNQARRRARAQRRQVQRRAKRKHNLLVKLTEFQLLPATEVERLRLFTAPDASDPYLLRKKSSGGRTSFI